MARTFLLSDDGLTQWHPAFLELGKSLEECTAKYRGFCKKSKPQPKPTESYHWRSQLVPVKIRVRRKRHHQDNCDCLGAHCRRQSPWAEWEP